MANPIGKDITIKIDNAAGSLTALTSHLNSGSITGIQNIINDIAFDDDEQSYQFGVAGATATMSGFYNTTVEAILGPLIGNRTTATKTFQYSPYASRAYSGEVLVTNIQVSGAPDNMETFSADMTFTGVMTRTSVVA